MNFLYRSPQYWALTVLLFSAAFCLISLGISLLKRK